VEACLAVLVVQENLVVHSVLENLVVVLVDLVVLVVQENLQEEKNLGMAISKNKNKKKGEN